MKSIIKSLLRESLLNEKLTNIGDDVNFLYVTYFEKDVNELEDTGIIRKGMFAKSETDTSVLKSNDCIEANKLNQCVIKVNTGTNYYSPFKNEISIGVSSPAIDFVLRNFKGDFIKAQNNLNHEQRQSLSREFSEERIKGSIHHELVHWVDDTLHNKHISKRLHKAMELGTRDVGGIPVNLSKMEIQAQIHNIKQLHNKYSDRWDEMTFKDMLRLSPPLTSVYSGLKDEYKTRWVKEIKVRMHREGLLGKNMANT